MISNTATTGLFDAIARAGGDSDRVLRAVRMKRSAIADRDGFIPSRAFARLLEESARATADPLFGLHFGARFDPRDIGLLGYVVMNSPNLATAMRNIERHLHIHNDAPRVSFTIEDDCACLRYVLTRSANTAIRHHNEYSMAVLVNAFRALSGTEWMPREIHFAHEAAEELDYRPVFSCPVRCGCATNALIVESDFIERYVATADPKLYRALCDSLGSALTAASPTDSLLHRVRKAIAESLECGDAKLDRVTATLAMSARTLQRRLAAQGVVYKDLVDGIRQHLALDYLKDERQTLTDIAFRLGYSEVSAFNRAFKRWTGLTPLESRARNCVDLPHGPHDRASSPRLVQE